MVMPSSAKRLSGVRFPLRTHFMALSYAKRLKIPLIGNDNLELFSKTGILLCKGYTRVVIGGRGPYVEFHDKHIIKNSFIIPPDLKYRVCSEICYYIEHRSIDESYVKLYHQKKLVSYADYKIGLYYISPFDLYMFNDLPVIV
jgi:hypothetical protein